jgi:hypothetical protein
MRKNAIIIGATVLATAAVAMAGGDVWKTKPYTQWDQKDVNTILQSSPWAKPAQQVQGAWRPDGTAAADTSNIGVAGSGTDTSNRSAGAGTNQPGGTEKQAEAQAAQQMYNVFWWSSRTIREASARRAVLSGAATQEQADKMVAAPVDSYQILVNSPNMAIFQRRGEDAFKQVAFLQTHKNKEKLAPSKVEFQKKADGTVIGAVFSFPKTSANGEPLISPDEKEVDFQLQIGASWLRTYFVPKQMVDSQGTDL